MYPSPVVFRHVALIHHWVLCNLYSPPRHYMAPVYEPGLDVLPQFPLRQGTLWYLVVPHPVPIPNHFGHRGRIPSRNAKREDDHPYKDRWVDNGHRNGRRHSHRQQGGRDPSREHEFLCTLLKWYVERQY
jgi:hypothetical protein